ncbi:pyruvate dehydrogenase E2 component (dihydrolipoamide acetyltransferase) [Tamaricihabitans halophyticus]|uniref:Dihydrolipoamide acetyltransferase component of pyruvate dehydrogenase complex n=1 Tax=Tamaricihabitans halophyticus TaxID=1262583 RepID=A0A4R2QVF8_9PSEU|nr:dihydrolipoamide acetyltransferase family protein [Tamaricihabitans halophyticus]TCP54030.1 pyruvate dehydrogenase E2 component (dihydrolipoamide acetyltransferase) [Tamaricihabitans halophyticus]
MREQPLVMPKMSMTMEEGTLVVWHKSPGDEIRSGDVVCEVTTDKVDMEVESPLAGTLARIVAQPEDVVPVGEPIAFIASDADDLLDGLLDGPSGNGSAGSGSSGDGSAGDDPAKSEPATASPTPVSANDSAASAQGSVAAVPYARTRAAELGVELATVQPTGPHGTIRVADVEGQAGQPAPAVQPAPAPAPAVPAPAAPARGKRGPRALIADRMSASAQIPQFTVYRELNLDTARRAGASWTAVLTHAFAHALRAFPALNAVWTGDDVQRLDVVGVALAVDTPKGLIAPVLRDPDLVTLPVLDRQLRELVGRARDGKLGLADLDGASTTVSNLGSWQVESFNALLTPPQATALSLGAVGPQVVPVEDGIGVRTRCRVGLTLDHRVGDGADGARLLATMQQLLEHG